MRSSKLARAAFFLALGCATGSSKSRADEDLPAVHTLPCTSICANSSRAIGISQPIPPWPQQFLDASDTYIEGYVRLHYKINTDGHVSDISVVSVVGPEAFAKKAISTVKDWTYKPAMLDGKPVETCHTLNVTFKMPTNKSDMRPGARPAIVSTYRAAIEDIQNNKLDEALVILKEALSQPKLNLYERGMLANVTSAIALQRGDYLEAHRASSVALEIAGSDLPKVVSRMLLETRLKSALFLGDLVDALDTQDRLKEIKDYDLSNPIFAALDQVRSKADSMPIFSVQAKIPEISQGENTYFGLYRRSFAFTEIKGSLSGFTLNCRQQSIESKISETVEWHVPKSWSDCRVLVRGAPGTTFKLAQLTD